MGDKIQTPFNQTLTTMKLLLNKNNHTCFFFFIGLFLLYFTQSPVKFLRTEPCTEEFLGHSLSYCCNISWT